MPPLQHWSQLDDAEVLTEAKQHIDTRFNAYGDRHEDSTGPFRDLLVSYEPVTLHASDLTKTDARQVLACRRALGPVKSAGVAAVFAVILAGVAGQHPVEVTYGTTAAVTFGWAARNTMLLRYRRRHRGRDTDVVVTDQLPAYQQVLLNSLARHADIATVRLREVAGERTAETVRAALIGDLFLAATKMREVADISAAIEAAAERGADPDLVADATAAQAVAHAAIGKTLKAVYTAADSIRNNAEVEVANARLRQLSSHIDNLRADEATDLRLESTLWRTSLTT